MQLLRFHNGSLNMNLISNKEKIFVINGVEFQMYHVLVYLSFAFLIPSFYVAL